jgi:hypothetical protein
MPRRRSMYVKKDPAQLSHMVVWIRTPPSSQPAVEQERGAAARVSCPRANVAAVRLMQWDGISAAPCVVNEKLCAVEVPCLLVDSTTRGNLARVAGDLTPSGGRRRVSERDPG